MTNLNLRKRIKKNPAYGRHRVSQPMRIEAPIQKQNIKAFFVEKKIKIKKMAGGTPAEKEIPCKCASIALRKVLACPEILVVYSMFLPNNHISYRLFALFPEICGGIYQKLSKCLILSYQLL